MYCPNCGALLLDDAKTCDRCGAAIETARPGKRLAPGYAQNIDAEPVLAALKKQNRITVIASAVLIVLPLIVFMIYGALASPMTIGAAIAMGIFISFVIALVVIITTLKRKLGKPFEGTVADKKHVRHSGVGRSRKTRSRSQWYICIDCDDGKRRKKDATSTVYNYLQIGDRVRYLPQFPQPFEKYDKSRDAEIPCMFCGKMNPPENETCSACKNPMVK